MNNRLYEILKDRYYNQKPIFQEEKLPPEQKTGQVKIESADLKPYHPLFKKLDDVTVKLLLPRCHLVRLQTD